VATLKEETKNALILLLGFLLVLLLMFLLRQFVFTGSMSEKIELDKTFEEHINYRQ